MNSLLPKGNGIAGSRLPTEQGIEALAPDQSISDQIPIPNCIVRSPGNLLMIILNFRRIGLSRRVGFVSIGFGMARMFAASLPFPRVELSCCSRSHSRAVARTREKATSVPLAGKALTSQGRGLIRCEKP